MKQKKKLTSLLIIALIVVAVVIVLVYAPLQKKVCYHATCFNVEIAETQEERALGLMHREHLDENAGMLFIFKEEGEHPFWMKNTLISLDMIWINAEKEVVYIHKDTPPCEDDPCVSYIPDKPALYVLELNAGKAEEIGLEVGDKLIF